MRIVTTLPSATEIVCALGLEPVGVSHECDYPPSVRDAPSITASRIDADASSGEIDRQVLEAADEGVYALDAELLDALDPELVVTQDTCDVCAVDAAVVDRALAGIDADPSVITTDPGALEDVLRDVERIGRAAGREERAGALIDSLEARVEAVRERAGDPADGPRVAVLDWTDPVMVAGHWVPELVAAAGGEYGMADPGDRSVPREWRDVLEYDPEVLIVAPCGFDLGDVAENRADLTEREGWNDLAAVREGRVWAMDGHHYVNRPGPRLVDTLEHVAPVVAPDRFDGPPPTAAVPFETLDRAIEG